MSAWLNHIRTFWKLYLLRFIGVVVFCVTGILILNGAEPDSKNVDLAIGIFGAAIGIFIDIVLSSFIAPIQSKQAAKDSDDRRIAELGVSLAYNSSQIYEFDNQIILTYRDIETVERMIREYQRNPTDEGMKVLDFHLSQWDNLR